jgi:hypothetical protein
MKKFINSDSITIVEEGEVYSFSPSKKEYPVFQWLQLCKNIEFIKKVHKNKCLYDYIAKTGVFPRKDTAFFRHGCVTRFIAGSSEDFKKGFYQKEFYYYVNDNKLLSEHKDEFSHLPTTHFEALDRCEGNPDVVYMTCSCGTLYKQFTIHGSLLKTISTEEVYYVA